jgi:hypothetical protein
MQADREERNIRAWIDSLQRAVASELSNQDLGRLAGAALGDDDAEVGEPIPMGDPDRQQADKAPEPTRR